MCSDHGPGRPPAGRRSSPATPAAEGSRTGSRASISRSQPAGPRLPSPKPQPPLDRKTRARPFQSPAAACATRNEASQTTAFAPSDTHLIRQKVAEKRRRIPAPTQHKKTCAARRPRRQGCGSRLGGPGRTRRPPPSAISSRDAAAQTLALWSTRAADRTHESDAARPARSSCRRDRGRGASEEVVDHEKATPLARPAWKRKSRASRKRSTTAAAISSAACFGVQRDKGK